MLLLIWGLSMCVYYLLHSLLVVDRVKAMLTRRLIPQRYYRIFYNFLSIVLLFPILLLYFQIEQTLLIVSTVLKFGGLAFVIIGVYLLFKSLKQYDLSEFAGTLYLKGEVNKKPLELSTSGLNALVRHPLYFASLLIFWGFFMYLPTAKILILAILSTLYLIIGIKLEEKKLVKEYGKAYQIYQKEVPMLLPKVTKLLTKRDA